jgi:SanA protein
MAGPSIKLRRISRRIVVVIAALGLIVAASTTNIVWEQNVSNRMVLPVDAPQRDIAIVLGAKPGRLLGYRMDAACALVTLGKTQRLLLTGTDEEMPFMRERARTCLPEDKILVDDKAERTLDNLKNARDRFGVTSALVVTQRFHLARALYLADHLGIDAVGVEAAGDARIMNAVRERFARMRARLDVLRM